MERHPPLWLIILTVLVCCAIIGVKEASARPLTCWSDATPTIAQTWHWTCPIMASTGARWVGNGPERR